MDILLEEVEWYLVPSASLPLVLFDHEGTCLGLVNPRAGGMAIFTFLSHSVHTQVWEMLASLLDIWFGKGRIGHERSTEFDPWEGQGVHDGRRFKQGTIPYIPKAAALITTVSHVHFMSVHMVLSSNGSSIANSSSIR